LKIITFKKDKMKNLLACILLLTTTVSFGQQERVVEDFYYNNAQATYDYMDASMHNDGVVERNSTAPASDRNTDVVLYMHNKKLDIECTHNGIKTSYSFYISSPVTIRPYSMEHEYHTFNAINAMSHGKFVIAITPDSIVAMGYKKRDLYLYVGKNK
jgi:hypothetical protein